MDNPIQLRLTMLEMFPAVNGGFFDFTLIPLAASKQHADAFVSKMFECPCAFQLR